MLVHMDFQNVCAYTEAFFKVLCPKPAAHTCIIWGVIVSHQ